MTGYLDHLPIAQAVIPGEYLAPEKEVRAAVSFEVRSTMN